MKDYIQTHSVVDVMVIVFTGLIAFAVLFGALSVLIIEMIDSTTDTTPITDTLGSIITGILGALLGLLAGKSEMANQPPSNSEVDKP